MDKIEVKNRIDELISLVNKYSKLYYTQDISEISDFEYDSLYAELKKLEEENPEFLREDSPTQRVGDEILTTFEQHTHKNRLYSLDNTYSYEDLRVWYEKICKEFGKDDIELVAELKIDGLAISLVYENGILKTGATRGNGSVGENITQNTKAVNAIPLSLTDKTVSVDVRGEIYMPYTSFNKLNAEANVTEQKTFANPRNAAAGTLRQLDSKIVAKRGLSMFSYAAIFEGENQPRTHYETLKRLDELGLVVNNEARLCKNVEEVIDFCKEFETKRFELNYATDGVVIKVNDISIQNALGFTAKSPKWATAFKFPPEQICTKLLDIEIGVGKTGAITPVAVLEPVSLGGSIVKRASLHNFDEIERLGVMIGDYVKIRKAAEIIPQVVSVKIKKRKGTEREIKIPEYCPVCHSQLEKPEGEVNIYCPNRGGCGAQAYGKIQYFASKPAMDIEGLGETLIKSFYEQGLISDSADLYSLTMQDLLVLEGFKEKLASNIINSIEGSKNPPLSRFITALSIKHVGKETAEIVAEHFGTFENFKNATVEEIGAIEGIGSKIAQEIADWFVDENNIKLLEKFKAYGVKPQEAVDNRVSSIFDGMAFVITGTLSKPRAEFETLIKSHGGKSSSAVSKNTSYVLAGESPGSKLLKAQTLGVKILDEDAFFALLGEN